MALWAAVATAGVVAAGAGVRVEKTRALDVPMNPYLWVWSLDAMFGRSFVVSVKRLLKPLPGCCSRWDLEEWGLILNLSFAGTGGLRFIRSADLAAISETYLKLCSTVLLLWDRWH